jgi:hypothetical protein
MPERPTQRRSLDMDERRDPKLVGLSQMPSVGLVVRNLQNARADNHGPNDTLDALVKNLQAVDAAPPPDAEVSDLFQEALSQVEGFRTQRDDLGTEEA